MRVSLFFATLLFLVACGGGASTEAEQAPPPVGDTPVVVDTGGISLIPLSGTGVRFDGAYHYVDGSLNYYMRFFERGSAAFVGGTEKYKGQLAELLTIDVPSGWNQVHNCPVSQRNDSLFIRSMSVKGAITYEGQVRADGDSVRFLRVSAINGSRAIFAYGFVPDAALAEEKAKVLQTQ